MAQTLQYWVLSQLRPLLKGRDGKVLLTQGTDLGQGWYSLCKDMNNHQQNTNNLRNSL